MDRVCRHESLMRPTCLHIYSTKQWDSERVRQLATNTKLKTLLSSLPPLCYFLFFSFLLNKNARTRRKTNPPMPRERSYLAHGAVWISSASVWIPTHSSLKQLSGRLSLSASKTRRTVFYQWISSVSLRQSIHEICPIRC